MDLGARTRRTLVRSGLGFLALGLFGVFPGLLRSAAASDLSYIPLDNWSYPAFYRLASLGLLPLQAVAARPITRLEAQRLVREARLSAQNAGPAILALAEPDLLRLGEEFSTSPSVTVSVGGLAGHWSTNSSPTAPIHTPRIMLDHSFSDDFLIHASAAGRGLAGPPLDEFYASFRMGSVLAQIGRGSLEWGPSLRSGLLLSDNAGTMPFFRLTAELPQARLTKVVAPLGRLAGPESDELLLFGTRLDWAVTPRFRIGLSEAVVTTWAPPLTLYHLLQPLPVVFSGVASAFFHDVLGQNRNTLASADFDWLPKLGLRLYGELLVDDPLPLQQARVGLLAGVYLADPFRTGRTSLKIEYSGVTNGTYSRPSGYEYAYMGRSLGYWLGPDGDDIYLELTHRLNPSTDLMVFYSFTRHGEGFIGQPPPPPSDLFLSGIVERRHAIGLQISTIRSHGMETKFLVEFASVFNLGNVAGADTGEGFAALDLTYRWPAEEVPGVSDSQDRTMPPSTREGSELTRPGRAAVKRWLVTTGSQGVLSGPTGGTFWGVEYATTTGSLPLSLSFDTISGMSQSFWSADVTYPIWKFEQGTVAVSAGWGGLEFAGTLGGTPHPVSFSAPKAGIDLFYQVTLNNTVTPIYLRSQITTTMRGLPLELYLWTHLLAVGWQLNGMTVEVGYRGAAVLWQPRMPDQSMLRWDGYYLSLLFQ